MVDPKGPFFGRILGVRKLRSICGAGAERLSLEDVLEQMNIRTNTVASQLAALPRTGATLVVANHPTGILDGAVLARELRAIRPDVRIVTNQLLRRIVDPDNLIVPVNVDRAGSVTGWREAVTHLRAGGLLLMFPSGEVAHRCWRRLRIAESQWRDSVVRLVHIAQRDGTSVRMVCAYLEARNRESFYAAGLLHPRLRTLLLLREFMAKRGDSVRITFSAPIPAAHVPGADTVQQTSWLRMRCEGPADKPARIARAVPAELLYKDVERLPQHAELARSGELRVLLARAGQIPNVLREIGVLREVTFREAGEGTGKALDLDRFDSHYDHLFLWNDSKREIAGAYRLRRTINCGASELYTATLFGYGESFLRAVGPAIELGRSFVRREYQRSYSALLLLWTGIGGYVAARPECCRLFGPVSISNTIPEGDRMRIAASLERNPASEKLRRLIPVQEHIAICEMPAVNGHSVNTPVLVRQYLNLGAKLLAFRTDPDFSNALDALILVDLKQTEPRLVSRYLGRAAADSFRTAA